MTMALGSGTLGSLLSSRRTSAESCVRATYGFLFLGMLRRRLLDGVPPELAAQGRDDLHGEGVVLAGGEPGEERTRDSRRRDVLVYRLQHGPAALAGVLHVAPDAIEVGIPLEGPLGEFQEPAAHHASL